ncbi:MAG: virion structural protein [Siphoviridae sp. ctdEk19]|nr:MAG: virion structural protein [Siphoviridae sp. ctdEk19]
MAYIISDSRIGVQPIADTSTTQQHPLGTIVRAVDPTYGEGEFIYLPGVASTAVGSLVTYNTSSYTTALAAVGANKPQPIAVAMSANVASQYGWYQISGIAVCKKTATVSLAANAAVGVLTIGLVAGTGSGKEITGALVAAVASAASGRTTVQVVINRPRMQGRVT